MPWRARIASSRVATWSTVDAEVRRLVDEAGVRAMSLLQENRAELDAVATALLERESLTGEELSAVSAAASPPAAAR